MDYDVDFISTFNEYYPFERYIMKEPKAINSLYDDAVLTEIFIPSANDKSYINDDDIYIKLRCNGVEFRMAYYDFSETLRENIRDTFYDDFGGYEYESLYMDYEDKEDYNELKEVLNEQMRLIKEKYGSCEVKPNFEIEYTKKLLKESF